MVDVADHGIVRRKLQGVLVPAGLRKSLGVCRRDSGKSSVTNDVEQHLPGIVLNRRVFAVRATIHHGFKQPSIKEHALVLGQTSPDRRLVWLVRLARLVSRCLVQLGWCKPSLSRHHEHRAATMSVAAHQLDHHVVATHLSKRYLGFVVDHQVCLRQQVGKLVTICLACHGLKRVQHRSDACALQVAVGAARHGCQKAHTLVRHVLVGSDVADREARQQLHDWLDGLDEHDVWVHDARREWNIAFDVLVGLLGMLGQFGTQLARQASIWLAGHVGQQTCQLGVVHVSAGVVRASAAVHVASSGVVRVASTTVVRASAGVVCGQIGQRLALLVSMVKLAARLLGWIGWLFVMRVVVVVVGVVAVVGVVGVVCAASLVGCCNSGTRQNVGTAMTSKARIATYASHFSFANQPKIGQQHCKLCLNQKASCVETRNQQLCLCSNQKTTT